MSEQRQEPQKWTIYVCPECGRAFLYRPLAEEHAAIDCHPDSWPWEPVEAIPASLLSESQAEVERLREMTDFERSEAARYLGELAESQARERQLEADYRDLLCAHPERQHEALQAYLSSSVGGERTIDAAREVLSSEAEGK